MVDISEYPAVLMRNLNSCVHEPLVFLAVLVLQLDGCARLDFIQVIANCFYTLVAGEVLS